MKPKYFKKLLLSQLGLCFILICPYTLQAQTKYPQTLRVPVTFYDFHSDSSNPEFEVNPPEDKVQTSMVAPQLDSEKKPVLGSSPFFNHMIAKWFRPWTPGDNQIYNYYAEYEEGKRFDRYQDLPAGLTTVDHDTSFKNIVIHDTLTFTYVKDSKGMYEFSSNAFFPLDNKGFGHEHSAHSEHNYSFTMEIHWTFTMVPGLVFNFQGDDDVWAFVNNELVMDLGGIHNPAFGQFNVDNLSGLTENKQYSFDFFYAERHVTGSNIRITTNIISSAPVVQLYDNPNPPSAGNPPITTLDTINAGDSATIFGHVFDTAGVWTEEDDEEITWRIEGAENVVLSTGKGPCTTIRTDTSLNSGQITIIAQFIDPDNPSAQPSEARLSAYIQGPPPDTIPDPPVNPPPPDTIPDPPVEPPPDTVTEPVEDHLDILADSALAYTPETLRGEYAFLPDVETQTLFAVVRDKNGAFIRFATEGEWQSNDGSIATVSPAHGSKTLMSKSNTAIGSKTVIIVREPGLTPDTLRVSIQGEERTGVLPNPFIPGVSDITTYLPTPVHNNYRNVLEAAGTNFVTLVIVEAPEPLAVHREYPANPKRDSYAAVRIYDAVGNLVNDKCTLIAGERMLTYGTTWKGYNRNGRRVGPGVYLMVIKGRRLSGKEYTVTHKIGIGSR